MKKQKSFTLIELLVVIAIIGLLSAITLVAIKEARERAKIAASLQFAAQVHHALGADAVGIWDLDNNLNDSSGSGNDGEWEGSGPAPAGNFKCAVDDKENTPSGQGCSLYFDGVDDYVDCGNDESLDITGNITLSAWVKSNVAFGTSKAILSYIDTSAGYGYGLQCYTGGLGFRAHYSVSGWQTTYYSEPPPYGQWIHLAVTYNGSKVQLYLNGEKDNSNDRSGTFRYTSQTMTIGRHTHLAGYYFNGTIDEVRIYEQALTSAQIKKLYAEGAEKRGLLTSE